MGISKIQVELAEEATAARAEEIIEMTLCGYDDEVAYEMVGNTITFTLESDSEELMEEDCEVIADYLDDECIDYHSVEMV